MVRKQKMNVIIGALIILGALLILLILLRLSPPGQDTKTAILTDEMAGLQSFDSWDEVSLFLESTSSANAYGYGLYYEGAIPSIFKTTAESSDSMTTASEYSTTNIQVEGVDEADIVKNDGKYIYAASKGNIIIIDAYPPQQMKIVSRLDVGGYLGEFFVYNDTLVVFGSNYRYAPYESETVAADAPFTNSSDGKACVRCVPPYYGYTYTFLRVYNISDRSSPSLQKEIEVKGNYKDSRMIGGKVYTIFTDYPDYLYPIPLYMVDGEQRQIQPEDIKYFDYPDNGYIYNIFVGLDLNNLKKEESRKILLTGQSQNLYVSSNSMYITYTRYSTDTPLWEAYKVYSDALPNEIKAKVSGIEQSNLSEWRKDRLKSLEVANYISNASMGSDTVAKAGIEQLHPEFYDKITAIISDRYSDGYLENETTVVMRIALDANFSVTGKGGVPGHVLNQFSMDEYNGYFRIATTSGKLSRFGSSTTNAVYVLGSEGSNSSNLSVIGKLEDLAPGESIYSARFTGNRVYLVTFKKVDPFFVIDLSDPAAPKLLGKLKIPGYSDYLHPYDENHVIGLGKGAAAAEEGDFAWYQGVKLSLFDVSDVSMPKEVAKFEIGDRGTDSYALHDHKAFLFSRKRNLLVIPILLAEIDGRKYPNGVEPYMYGDYTFQGAYVMSVSPEDGFKLKGRISHVSDDSLAKSGDYYWSDSNVKRSLYMDDYLYTISDAFVKANDLSDLKEISLVQIS